MCVDVELISIDAEKRNVYYTLLFVTSDIMRIVFCDFQNR